MQGVIDAISAWSGFGTQVITAVMGAAASGLAIWSGVAIKNRVKRRRRGYYR